MADVRQLLLAHPVIAAVVILVLLLLVVATDDADSRAPLDPPPGDRAPAQKKSKLQQP